MRAALLFLFAWAFGAEAWNVTPPLGLDAHLPTPLTNPITRQKVALGRKLFFDKRLSRDGTLSCASCHDPESSFSERRPLSRGIGDAETSRNSPTLINRGYGAAFFWDGRTSSLEALAIEPIVNPRELGSTTAEVERRTGMSAVAITFALASYMRTIRSGDSRFDRYAAGDTEALDDVEVRGLRIFAGEGGCASCHAGPNFTDERFHNTGVAWREGRFADEGRFTVSGLDRDRGAFKTPTLRDLVRTAPYMHDGSLETLDEVVDFYASGGRRNPHLDPIIQPRNLAPDEKHALVAFLRSLTGRIREGVR